MIDWLLTCIPGRLTGRLGTRAHQQVRGWTKNNTTLRALKYGQFRSFLLRSTDHPFVFALLMGAVALIVAYLFSIQPWGFLPKLKNPALKDSFDLEAYAGVPWTVQATLVALVYPIVLSFIALMLQRRTHSSVAMRVYVLDSAVVPAGASSIGLLLVMSIQYFSIPYSSDSFLTENIAPLILFNGTWLAGNLFLTGFFLTRTIRFIQEEEQLHAYTRIAINVALRTELMSTIKQHIYVDIPYADWDFPPESDDSNKQPRVSMFSFNEGTSAVKRELNGSLVLNDVHSHFLKWVVKSWSKRAQKHKDSTQKTPRICFPQRVGEVATGEVVLCRIENGPPLKFCERMLVKSAFWYRKPRLQTLSLTTRRMLDEIGGEVVIAIERHQFGAAELNLKHLILLHEALLLACIIDCEKVAGNTATIHTSPYSLGDNHFGIEWLKPYREIASVAARYLEEDSRILRQLANIPVLIAAKLPPTPENLIIDLMLIGKHLTFQLGEWWTRKVDACLLPGVTSFNGTLPAPSSKVYEQVLTDFIGRWGQIYIRVPKNQEVKDEATWAALTARAKIYKKHINYSAEMFLNAVSRCDEVASSWFYESFIKWWGNRQYELRYDRFDIDKFQMRHATLTLADKTWPEALNFLYDGENPVTIDLADKAMNLAIHRYWESMRLYIALHLIHNAESPPSTDSRELRLAAALIKGIEQKPGGKIECLPLDDMNTVITAILELKFGLESVINHIDHFPEWLNWNNQSPEVPNWIYRWSGSQDFHSMKQSIAILLVALFVPCGRNISKNKSLIESWWKDLDKLESVGRYCSDLYREVQSPNFDSVIPVIILLQKYLGITSQIQSAKAGVANVLDELRIAAQYERIITLRVMDVDELKVKYLAKKISTLAFDPKNWTLLPNTSISLEPELLADLYSVQLKCDKKLFVTNDAGIPQDQYIDLAKTLAENIQKMTLEWSFNKRITEAKMQPVNTTSLRNNYHATVSERQNFISSVGAHCANIRTGGVNPVVFVGQAAAPRTYLAPWKWGTGSWQCPPPAGITLRSGDQSKGEPAVTFINEAPVFELNTPNGDCYVVSSSLVNVLNVAGVDTSSVLNIQWTPLNDERLKLEFNWKAGFR